MGGAWRGGVLMLRLARRFLGWLLVVDLYKAERSSFIPPVIKIDFPVRLGISFSGL